ncbi:unnamed protein product [Brachionus calyciflorus]|uniref:Alpha-1,3-glucosyltransferase n=1 Tax=Brachionus calyciflorus TaxID=104777 RepID=A0A813NX07_9BILA|nr:unnamed protein product [Brachionus calyciflorus]
MSEKNLILSIILLAGLFKVLLFPAYHSTDFEVHRNWLAITHSLPIEKWYYENTSEWTLDYPPFFAYFEYVLSQPAKYIDKEMLRVDNLNYKSTETIYYQRTTVILTELILVYSLLKILNKVDNAQKKDTGFNILNSKCFLTIQFVANFALIMVDNIHFQYNGFLFGIMMLSIYHLQNKNWIVGSVLFSTLLNLKHIYLYVAPAYFFYILTQHVLKTDSLITKFTRLITIGFVSIVPFVLSLGPFINHIPQLLTRLFPFKRGLSHAYWAPNVWALYNFGDKISSILIGSKSKSSLTSGLVQDVEHVVFPSIPPKVTFILSLIFMLVPMLVILKKKNIIDRLINLIVICAFSSFLFGWHVHEKAVLMILIPASILAVKDKNQACLYFFMTTISYYSLFPLIYKNFEYPIKIVLFVMSVLYNYEALRYQFKDGFKLKKIEIFYLGLIILLEFYNSCLHYVISFDKKLPYLPLMLTSVYCSLGIIYSWAKYLFLILIK